MIPSQPVNGYAACVADTVGCIRRGVSVAWSVADSVLRAKQALGDSYTQYLADVGRAVGLDEHTLDNYALIAERFPIGSRSESLSLSHHDALTGLDDSQRSSLLTVAELQGMSVKQLREAVRSLRGSEEPRPIDWQGVACALWCACPVELRPHDLQSSCESVGLSATSAIRAAWSNPSTGSGAP